MNNPFSLIAAMATEKKRAEKALVQNEELTVPSSVERGNLEDYAEEMRNIPSPTLRQLEESCFAALRGNQLAKVQGKGQYMVPIVLSPLPEDYGMKVGPLDAYPLLRFAFVNNKGLWGSFGYLGHYLPEAVNNNKVLLDWDNVEINDAITEGHIPFSVFKDSLTSAVRLSQMLWKDVEVAVPDDETLHALLASEERKHAKTKFA